jgi:hypothetical protein
MNKNRKSTTSSNSLPETPYYVPTCPSVYITKFGSIYHGGQHSKYMRRKNNMYLHPIPIGYEAIATLLNNRQFKCKVKEGDSGPVYLVTDMNTKIVYTGTSCSEPWNEIYQTLGLGQRVAGTSVCILFFICHCVY